MSVRFFGNYELLEEIARGGMGVVYKARQLSLKRTVALKMIRGVMASDPAFVSRFRREAEAAARLQHPNIVAIHEIGEQQGQPYFSMDYVAGPNLEQLVTRTPLSPRRAALYALGVAKAIAHAHQQGVLHRDLKPSNVLVDAFDQPRVTDFGLARELQMDSGLTMTGQVMGTPNYMSPEQAGSRRGRVDVATDVYGLGAVLYFLLTGRPPFHGQTLTEVLRLVSEAEPVPLRLLNPAAPRDLETICLKCLEKEPHRRYPTAGDLAEELERFLRGEPIRARPVNPPEKAWRWCRRNPVVAGLAGGLMLIFGLGFIGVLWQWQEAEKARRVAETAQRDSTEKLWGSYLAQARANRWSGQSGRRFESLDVLSKASAIRPSFELRNEAIACLALPDLQVSRQWKLPPGQGIAFDADLERYAWADTNGNIRVHRVGDGAELIRLPGDRNRTRMRLKFSPDGRYLAGNCEGTGGGVFRLWNLVGQEAMVTQPMSIYAFAVEFAPDSQSVVAADRGGQVHRYDLLGRHELNRIGIMANAGHLSFCPEGERLAICSDLNKQVEIVEIDSGRFVQRLDAPAGVHDVAWSPDGRVLACACRDQMVYLYDVSTGEQKTALAGHTAQATAVLFNRRGDLLVSYGWDGQTRFWDPVMGEALVSTPGAPVYPFHRNADALGFFVFFSDAGIWSVSAARECRRLGFAGLLTGGWFRGQFSPDGRLLAVASSDGVRLWEVETGQQLCLLPLGASRAAVFHPSGDSLLVCSQKHGLQRWPIRADLQTAECQLGPPVQLGPPGLGEISTSRDGQWLAAVSKDGALVLNLKSQGGPELFQGHPQAGWVAISPDAQWVATGTWKGQGVRIWEVQTGKPITELPVPEDAAVRFSPEGKWLVTGEPDAYRFWEVGRWTPGLTISRDRAGDVAGSMVFSPDGAVLALVHGRLAGVKLITVPEGRELAFLDTGTPLAFSPDGGLLATIGADQKRLLLWDLRLIRRQLAAMDLDWNLPPLEASASRPISRPLHWSVCSEQSAPDLPDFTPGTSVSITLGKTNSEQGLRLCPNDDGVTEPVRIGAHPCYRALKQPDKGSYVYFAVDLRFKAGMPRDLTIQVEYFDAGRGEFRVQYDASSDAMPSQGVYASSRRSERLTDTRQWKRTAFVLPGATLRNAQNAKADFRLETTASVFFVRRVTLGGLAATPLTE